MMLLDNLLSFIFPDAKQCYLCGDSLERADICAACLHKGQKAQKHIAHIKPEYITELHALTIYTEQVRRRLHALKFNNKPAFARSFAQAVDCKLILAARYDLVTAVPMHRQRYIQRGYNQAELLAKEIAALQRLPCRQLLKRDQATKPQHTLGKQARRTNVAGAFSIIGNVEGLKVLVVDDILTTGSTLGAVARCLVNAGASQVDALVVAVSLPNSAGQ